MNIQCAYKGGGKPARLIYLYFYEVPFLYMDFQKLKDLFKSVPLPPSEPSFAQYSSVSTTYLFIDRPEVLLCSSKKK